MDSVSSWSPWAGEVCVCGGGGGGGGGNQIYISEEELQMRALMAQNV